MHCDQSCLRSPQARTAPPLFAVRYAPAPYPLIETLSPVKSVSPFSCFPSRHESDGKLPFVSESSGKKGRVSSFSFHSATRTLFFLRITHGWRNSPEPSGHAH
jgi:hypothetical protein